MRPALHQLLAITRLIRGWGLLARASLLAIVLLFFINGFALAGDVHVSIKKPTNLPAQPLGAALQALAKDRNFQVVYVTEEVNSLRTRGAVGELTREEALQQLLEGTGLTFRYLDEMTVIIIPASAGTNTDVLPPQSAQGTGTNSAAERPRASGLNAFIRASAGNPPEEITITGSRLHVASVATASPLTVITQQQIEMMGFSTVEDIIVSLPRNYSSINAATTLDNYMNSTDSQGQSAADLRGLGPENTLILVNGRRRAPTRCSKTKSI